MYHKIYIYITKLADLIKQQGAEPAANVYM